MDSRRRSSTLASPNRSTRSGSSRSRPGFRAAVGELLAERGARVDLEILGIPDEHVDHGAQKLWRHHYGLDAAGIAAAIRRRWPRLAPVRSDSEETAG